MDGSIVFNRNNDQPFVDPLHTRPVPYPYLPRILPSVAAGGLGTSRLSQGRLGINNHSLIYPRFLGILPKNIQYGLG